MITFDHIRAAVTIPNFESAAAHNRMAPRPSGAAFFQRDDPPREAGVLVLIYPQQPDDLHLVLTRRTEHLNKHSGQISFPGGRHDEQDTDFTATALRETCEELGFCETEQLEIVGRLSKFYIPPSHFDVYPIVALLPTIPHFQPAAQEVAEVLTLSLRDLLNPATRHDEWREIMGYRFLAPYYLVAGHKVWGATAAMLGELEARLRVVVPAEIQAALTHLG
jgi:8-oxo-dGTP pyrophosphatase MutT (NUDIX family)